MRGIERRGRDNDGEMVGERFCRGLRGGNKERKRK